MNVGKAKWIGAWMVIVPIFVYAYTVQIGYLSGAGMMALSQQIGVMYVSTGIGANNVAALVDQRLGVSFQVGSNISFFVRGGGDISLLMAYNGTQGVLFSVFGAVGIEYKRFELGMGLYKGVKALNYSRQLVNFGKCFPEVEIGYSW